MCVYADTEESLQAAKGKVEAILSSIPSSKTFTETLMLPTEARGRVIGAQGNNVRKLREVPLTPCEGGRAVLGKGQS